jgi:putative ABC transport system permease protein
VSPASILDLYRIRLRSRLTQECFALVGIAAGVALLFAAQISSQSLGNSVGQLARGIAGRATLQLLARDPHGLPQNLLARVRRIEGVHVAAPLVEVNANAIGRSGSASVELVGADSSLNALGGELIRHTELEPFGGVGALALPAQLARQLGAQHFDAHVTLQTAGRSVRAPLYEVLSAAKIGPLVSTPVVLAPLSFAQEIAGLQGRLSRILIQPVRGDESKLEADLKRLFSRYLDVEPITYEGTLFAKAAQASNQSTELFAAVSAIIGFLLAFNAVLLTVPQRRRLAIDLRRDGYSPRAVTAVLVSDAVALGAVACVLGLALGDLLSLYALHSNPAFLSLAFTLGSQRSLSPLAAASSCAAGMFAATAAVLVPLRDLLRGGSPAASQGSDAPPHWRLDPLWGGASLGLLCLVAGGLILHWAPGAAIPAMTLLLAALVLMLPLALRATLAVSSALADVFKGAVPHLAVAELRAAGSRAVAISATGAVATFGSVAIAGAHHDLLAGLEGAARETSSSSAVWVHPRGAYDLLETTPFQPLEQTSIERVPGVAAVRSYRGGLLDYGQRRVLVIAPPASAVPLLPTGQILDGDKHTAGERVRDGGWLVLSRAIAEEQHLHVGQTVTLPSPDPQPLRIAALTTNLGWAPGAIVMNAADYARAWDEPDTTAYGVLLSPGANASAVAGLINQALTADPGLTVETAARRSASQDSVSRQALARLSQIATLIPIAAVLAIVAALAAMAWQARPRMARLRLEGLSHRTLLGMILLEGALLSAAGALTGALFGLYGQRLVDHTLSGTINFPVEQSITLLPALVGLALVILPTLAVLSIPGHLMTRRIPPTLALCD